MKRFTLLVAVLLLVGGAAFFGLQVSGDESGEGSGSASKAKPGQPDRGGSSPNGSSPGAGTPEPSLPESSCPPDLANCVVASGRVIYVEAVDPDGDGDAHFVTTSNESVTFPGVTIFDVRTDLRPEPLPGVGDLIGGAGPVFRGSRGQKQIEVVEFHVAR